MGVKLSAVTSVADTGFSRAFELLNKSNQFNTTGRRWTRDECQTSFNQQHVFWTFDVEDRFTKYGVVGVVIVGDDHIKQFVMSCRVIGLEVEDAVISALVDEMLRGGSGAIIGDYVATDANHLCRDLYAKCGFVECEGGWMKPQGLIVSRPAHIRSFQVQPDVIAHRAGAGLAAPMNALS